MNVQSKQMNPLKSIAYYCIALKCIAMPPYAVILSYPLILPSMLVARLCCYLYKCIQYFALVSGTPLNHK